MPIHFSFERWEKLRGTYARWWAGTLDRPVAKVVVDNACPPEGPLPAAPYLDQSNCNDFSFTAEEVIEALDAKLSRQEYLGDAFPFVSFDCFGPGVLAAFCGAKLDNSTGRVWFFPEEELPIDQIHIQYDPQNPWVRRIKDIYRAGNERWKGMVLMGMPDLGGVMDVVATFCGAENLLLALYDEPEEVLRLCREAQNAWMQAYLDMNETLKPVNPGYSDWGGVYSEKPSYILQSDFSYMIGPDMFRGFVLPFLREACCAIDNTIFHLDGIGELPHLDDLLSIPELNAVQWVYGDGKPTAKHWMEVYHKIAAAGKGIYLIGDFAEVAPQFGGKVYLTTGASTVEQGAQLLKELGVPLWG